MDFTTTEASEDLGGLVRTITESVCTTDHQRDLIAIFGLGLPRSLR